MDVVDGETGEVIGHGTLAEAAAQMIEKPPYWRKTKHGPGFYIEGDWGKDFELAFYEVQKKIGPLILVDSQNDFNKSRYASLKSMLGKIQPILHEHRFTIRQGTGKISSRNDLGPQKAYLPVWLQLTHVDSMEWQCVTIEMPLVKHDAQSQKAAFTFGRRCDLEGYFSLAPTDDDDGILASHQLTPEMLDEMTLQMIDKILACENEAALRKWLSENKQQFELLGAQREEQLKSAWQTRMNELKPTKKGTKSNG